ncbi:DNA-directed RNA polymerase specialized sigma24 family protein [Peribacillus deserti]|uniref:DNA-directed RNA polymerase specialized sigma24 family protein n=1 Tax=Peribacillus deserti TaxID=673318 RepID=A0ABS2QKL7_9BACI|nr:sigma factor [Peribacillus deserti]MBM7693721.1 DNA-directed RNA polymerase specialized sigma24 family protein [Peribacillus deserti]
MAFLFVNNEGDALDIVQDTIYKAFISIKQLKEPKYFSTWISRILINTTLDFIKKITVWFHLAILKYWGMMGEAY